MDTPADHHRRALVWEGWMRIAGDSNLIARPSAIAHALLANIFSDPQIRAAIGLTLVEVVAAYALCRRVGLAIGLFIGAGNFSRRSLYPIILLLYAIPQVVLLPLFTLGFGIGPAAKIAFGFSHGVFPIVVNIVAGMQNVEPAPFAGGASDGRAARSDIVRNVIFPIWWELLRRAALGHDHDALRRDPRRALRLHCGCGLLHQAVRGDL